MNNDDLLKQTMNMTNNPIFEEMKKAQDLAKKTMEVISSPVLEEMKKIQELTSSPVMKIVEDMENLKKLSLVQPQRPPLFTMPVDQNLASEFHTRLIKWIQNFNNELDQEHEVGVRLVNFGQTVTFHLKDIGHWNPSLISFSGNMENGDPVELIQHVSQISILLIKMKREDPTLPKRPIGFADWKEEHPEGM